MHKGDLLQMSEKKSTITQYKIEKVENELKLLDEIRTIIDNETYRRIRHELLLEKDRLTHIAEKYR